MIKLTRNLLLSSLAVAATCGAQAGLIGQQVSGSFTGYLLDVPPPASTTIVDPGAEFLFSNGGNSFTIDFSDDEARIVYNAMDPGARSPLSASFTSLTAGLFKGVTEVSDNFLFGGLSASLAGDTITFSWAGGDVFSSEDGLFEATFRINTDGLTVPEPHSVALALMGLLGVAASRIRPLRRALRTGGVAGA